jgi:predicted lipid-binding transport protein (Tim44 family)
LESIVKKTLTVCLLALASAALVAVDADARRLGGGRSLGTQRSVAPEPTRPAQQAPANASSAQPAPANPGAAATRPPAPPSVPLAAPPAQSRWLAPLAGIAAGLGLAALLSHFGLSAEFGGVLLLALLVGAGVFVLRRVLLSSSRANEPVRYAAAAGDSARPIAREPAFAPSAQQHSARVPPDFDSARFLAQARIAFNQLQAAFDRGDRKVLADLLTPEMYEEVGSELGARVDHRPTEVVKLDAELTEVVTEGDRHWASVRFSGLLREDGEPLPKAFDEVWHLSKPVDDTHGWLLAGIQQMQEALH